MHRVIFIYLYGPMAAGAFVVLIIFLMMADMAGTQSTNSAKETGGTAWLRNVK